MGGAALRRPGPVRALLERASAALGRDLAELIEKGDPLLTSTELAQPALVAVSLGLALECEVKPGAVAGHSVGELAAFSLAGCLSPEAAIDCALERARLMGQAARRADGSMAAIRSEAEVVKAQGLGLELAAHNGPDEWVVSGPHAALAAINGVRLPVSGPWHSRAMAEAARQWRVSLAKVAWARPRVALICNATGAQVTADDDLAQLLAGQLTRPVQWAHTLGTIAARGASRWHIFGPGRVLRGLCRANLGTVAAVHLHDG